MFREYICASDVFYLHELVDASLAETLSFTRYQGVLSVSHLENSGEQNECGLFHFVHNCTHQRHSWLISSLAYMILAPTSG